MRQEHLYLFDGVSLVFIQNNKGIVQRSAADIGQWRNFNYIMFDQLLHALKAKYFK